MRFYPVKEKGSKFYGIVKGWDNRPYTTEHFDSKKKALKECAKLSGMDFKEYMKMYRKEFEDDSDREL